MLKMTIEKQLLAKKIFFAKLLVVVPPSWSARSDLPVEYCMQLINVDIARWFIPSNLTQKIVSCILLHYELLSLSLIPNNNEI